MAWLVIVVLLVSRDRMADKDACAEADFGRLEIRVQWPQPEGCPALGELVNHELCHIGMWLATGDPDREHHVCAVPRVAGSE